MQETTTQTFLDETGIQVAGDDLKCRHAGGELLERLGIAEGWVPCQRGQDLAVALPPGKAARVVNGGHLAVGRSALIVAEDLPGPDQPAC